MTRAIGEDFYDDNEGKVGLGESGRIHINDLKHEAANLIQRTNELSSNISSAGATGPSLIDRVSIGRPNPMSLDDIQTNLAAHKNTLKTIAASPNPLALDFPNLAWEAIKAGLAKEQMTNNQLNQHIKEAEQHQKDIDLLLDFSAELTGHKEDEEMTEKMKTLLKGLKDRGIDLWKGEESKLSKEKISELKSLASSQVDKLRSNLQIIFTTKIQVLIQSISAIMEILKDVIRNNNKLISAANRLPGH